MNEEIVQFLMPHMQDPDERKWRIQSALGDSKVLDQIDWSGSASVFTRRLVDRLNTFGGNPEIEKLLLFMKTELGENHQQTIAHLIAKLSGEGQQAPPQPASPAPEPPKPVTLPANTPDSGTANKPAARRSRIPIEVIIGVIGLILAAAALIPEQTRTNLFQSIGLVAVPSATPTATSTPTDAPTATATSTDAPTSTPTTEASATLEPTTAFTATFTDVPPTATFTDLPPTMTPPPPTEAPTDTPRPADIPTTAPTTASVAQASSATLRLSREQNMFVVYAPQNPAAGLDTVTFRYTSGSTTRTTLPLARFPSFGLDFAALTQPACFVFRVQGDNTPLPMDCQSSGTLVFTQSLSSADIFWRDGFGQSLTLLVMQGETQIGLCGAGNATCEVSMGANTTPTLTDTVSVQCAVIQSDAPGVTRITQIYSRPSTTYPQRSPVDVGLTVIILDQAVAEGVDSGTGTWYLVAQVGESQSNLGWIQENHLEFVSPCS